MGKASSSKKVARAAGIGGGRSHRRQTPWAYFGVIGLIVALGLAGTVFSRHQRDNAITAAGDTGTIQANAASPVFEAYAVDICGTFEAPIKTPAPNPHGITAYNPGSGTKAPADGGVIQIQPTSKDFAGKNATLGKFTDAVGIKLNAAALQLPGGKQYLANSSTCDGKTGVVYVKEFNNAQDPVGRLYDGGKKTKTNPDPLPKLAPQDVPLKPNVIITIAFVPSSWATATCPASTSANPTTVTGCIPAPNPDVDSLLAAAVSAASQSTPSDTVPATSSSTTLPATPSSTTAPAGSSSTTRP